MMNKTKYLMAAVLVAAGLSFSGCAGGHTTVSVGVGVGYPYGWGGVGVYGVGTGGVHYGGYWR
jgi:hypothetical protein